MTCLNPLTAYRVFNEKTGKHEIVFNYKSGRSDEKLKLPCGQCLGCRLEYSRQWAIRCVHESTLHKFNSFITLTYNNDFLPADGSLCKKDFQRFMKRLRQTLWRRYKIKIRFFHCGEYGSKNLRPHFHAIIFGYDFGHDRCLWKITPRGDKIYRSALLEELWPYGFSTIGDCTFESCAYVSRYIVKKIKGDKELARKHYGDRVPEYTTMSRRPGIGQRYFEKWHSDIYPHDRVWFRGKEMQPPRYYDKLCLADPELFAMFEEVDFKRQQKRMDSDFNQLDEYEQFKELQRKRQYLEYNYSKRFHRNYEENLNV